MGVIGRVGSGKTTFLQTIIGELYPLPCLGDQNLLKGSLGHPFQRTWFQYADCDSSRTDLDTTGETKIRQIFQGGQLPSFPDLGLCENCRNNESNANFLHSFLLWTCFTSCLGPSLLAQLPYIRPYVYSFMSLINPCFGLVCATLLLREATGLRRPDSLPWESEDDQLTHAMALAYRKLQKLQDPAIQLKNFQLPTSVLSISSNASRIAVVSVCYPQNEDYATICRVARENFQRYSEDHGYQLIFHNKAPSGLAGRDAAWGKVLALQAALSQPSVDYVFWMDGDSLFMNQDRSLEALIPTGENQLTMTGDRNCFLNSGHLMLKKGNWTEDFLNKTWAMYPPPEPKGWWEQSSMIYLLSGLSPEDKDAKGCKADVQSCCSSRAGKGCDVRPQGQMNRYLNSFGSGDFILHFAGKGGWEKATLMEQYAQRVLPRASTAAAHAQLAQFHTTLQDVAPEFLLGWGRAECYWDYCTEVLREKNGTRGVAASYQENRMGWKTEVESW